MIKTRAKSADVVSSSLVCGNGAKEGIRGGGVFFQHRHHGRAALFAQGIDAVCIERNPCRQPFVLRVQAAISISHPLVREQIMFDLHQRHTFVFKFDNAVAAPEQGKAARFARRGQAAGLLGL